ncbi:alpha/beta fold hydrolase [Variovorax sp. H27-G14]|uniref:alpha/beta fold hydrolase n=1 Tax=Variovorax sp. H27-G14 TaxID=3111914 RepID=UPI0038FBEBEE
MKLYLRFLRALSVATGLALSLAGAGCSSLTEAPGAQGVMYVGGRYTDDTATAGIVEQAYVYYQIPAGYRSGGGKWPVVMVHGSQQTGANFLGTPDGRPGWAADFLRRGWPVYVIDQPGRGKSGYFPSAYGAQAKSPQAAQVQALFTAPELTSPPAWPEAVLHTQWPGGPGSGKPGNLAFDQFMASQVANMPEYKQALSLTTKAIGELLKHIGPAVLITHSMTGPVSWMVPQANPGMIKAIIAVEPTGNSSLRSDAGPGSACGLSDDCLRFSPPLETATELNLVKTAAPTKGLQSCWLQGTVVRALPDLNGIPILIATGEASYHAQYDQCTSEFLTQAGVGNTWVNLSSVGLKGNGHMQMIESNSQKIADFYEGWLRDNIHH